MYYIVSLPLCIHINVYDWVGHKNNREALSLSVFFFGFLLSSLAAWVAAEPEVYCQRKLL